MLKFYGDLDANWSDPDPGIWGGDDLVGSYHLRDAIESGLDLLDAATGFRKVAVLSATDELFQSFTVDDEDGWLRVFDRTLDPGRGWWWQRIPRSGPVLQQMAELRHSSG